MVSLLLVLVLMRASMTEEDRREAQQEMDERVERARSGTGGKFTIFDEVALLADQFRRRESPDEQRMMTELIGGA